MNASALALNVWGAADFRGFVHGPEAESQHREDDAHYREGAPAKAINRDVPRQLLQYMASYETNKGSGWVTVTYGSTRLATTVNGISSMAPLSMQM